LLYFFLNFIKIAAYLEPDNFVLLSTQDVKAVEALLKEKHKINKTNATSNGLSNTPANTLNTQMSNTQSNTETNCESI
jgi:hypothetical protein